MKIRNGMWMAKLREITSDHRVVYHAVPQASAEAEMKRLRAAGAVAVYLESFYKHGEVAS